MNATSPVGAAQSGPGFQPARPLESGETVHRDLQSFDRWVEKRASAGAATPDEVWNAIAAGDVREVSKLTVGAP